jgi:hypothetical protein
MFESSGPGETVEFVPCKGCGLNSVGKDEQDPTKIRVTYSLNPPPIDLDELPSVLYPDRRINSHFTSHHAKSRFMKMVRLAKRDIAAIQALEEVVKKPLDSSAEDD